MSKRDYTLCIICKSRLYHHHDSNIMFNRIAHPSCASLMVKLNKCLKEGKSIQKFAQGCIKYDIEPTQKALLMELAIKNL